MSPEIIFEDAHPPPGIRFEKSRRKTRGILQRRLGRRVILWSGKAEKAIEEVSQSPDPNWGTLRRDRMLFMGLLLSPSGAIR